MADAVNITRRRALAIIPAAGAFTAFPNFSAAADETPIQKVDRLSKDLAYALDDYWDGSAHAVVFPASSGYGISMRVTNIFDPANHRADINQVIERHKTALACFEDTCDRADRQSKNFDPQYIEINNGWDAEEREALMRIANYRTKTREEASIKSEYLLSVSGTCMDIDLESYKAVLRSMII